MTHSAKSSNAKSGDRSTKSFQIPNDFIISLVSLTCREARGAGRINLPLSLPPGCENGGQLIVIIFSGNPKGAMITHKNIISMMSAVIVLVKKVLIVLLSGQGLGRGCL